MYLWRKFEEYECKDNVKEDEHPIQRRLFEGNRYDEGQLYGRKE